MLQVAIGDASARVVGRDQTVLDVLGEGIPPDIGVAQVVVEYAAHPRFGCVSVACLSWVLRHHFSEVGRTVAEASC